MEWAIKIDTLLLNNAERFAHWFQRQTGKDNIFLASLCKGLIVLILALSLGYDILSGAGAKSETYLKYFAAALLLSGLRFFQRFEEYRSVRRISGGLSNPYKTSVAFRLMRISGLFIMVMAILLVPFALIMLPLFLHRPHEQLDVSGADLVYVAGFYSLQILLILHLYFLSCDPLPPCTGKLTEKLRAWFGKTVPQRTSR